MDVTEIAINIPNDSISNKPDINDSNSVMSEVFGPRKQKDPVEQYDTNLHHSKINVMDSEIIDDVDSEFSMGTDRQGGIEIFAQSSTPVSIKSASVSLDYPSKSPRPVQPTPPILSSENELL